MAVGPIVTPDRRVCVYILSSFVLLLNTPQFISDLVLLPSHARRPPHQYKQEAGVCSKGKAAESRICNADFSPQDQVALLWRTPTISRKRLKWCSRPRHFLKAFCWLWTAQCPVVTSCGSDHIDNHMWIGFSCSDENSVWPHNQERLSSPGVHFSSPHSRVAILGGQESG